MSEEKDSKPRPYWHVDLKWICGIFVFIALFAASVLCVVSTIMSPSVAIPTATYIAAQQFSKNGLDDPKDIEKIKKELEKTHKTEFKPFEGVDARITKSDLNNLTPREIRLKLFRQVVEPIYHSQASKETMRQYGVVAFINEKMYGTLTSLFAWSLVVSAVFIAGLVYFSHRFGKLVSPALLLLTFGTLPTLLLFMIQATKASDDNGLFGLPHERVVEIAGMMTPFFYTMFFVGVALLLAIPVIKLSSRFMPKNKKSKQ